MEDLDQIEGTPDTNASKAKKRALTSFLRDAQDIYGTPSKHPYCSQSLSSRVTDWLSQVPPESAPESALEHDIFDPDTMSRRGGSSMRSSASRTTTSKRGTQLVAQATYLANLKDFEGICVLAHDDPQMPKHISDLCNEMRKHCTSPEFTLMEEAWATLKVYQMQGTTEPQVVSWFKTHAFPRYEEAVGKNELQDFCDRSFKNFVPISKTEFAKMSELVPDLVYGYARSKSPFTGPQTRAGYGMDPPMGMVDAAEELSFPFFVIEFKAYGSTNGNLWVATNQCIGGSLTCVEAISELNELLEHNNVSRRKMEECRYYMQKVVKFDLEKRKGFLKFRRYVHNILDWGKGPRLDEIRQALDLIAEAKKGKRSAPSESISSSRSKRLKALPSNYSRDHAPEAA